MLLQGFAGGASNLIKIGAALLLLDLAWFGYEVKKQLFATVARSSSLLPLLLLLLLLLLDPACFGYDVCAC